MNKISRLEQVKADAKNITLKRMREQLEEEAEKSGQLSEEKQAMLDNIRDELAGKPKVTEPAPVVETKKGK